MLPSITTLVKLVIRNPFLRKGLKMLAAYLADPQRAEKAFDMLFNSPQFQAVAGILVQLISSSVPGGGVAFVIIETFIKKYGPEIAKGASMVAQMYLAAKDPEDFIQKILANPELQTTLKMLGNILNSSLADTLGIDLDELFYTVINNPLVVANPDLVKQLVDICPQSVIKMIPDEDFKQLPDFLQQMLFKKQGIEMESSSITLTLSPLKSPYTKKKQQKKIEKVLEPKIEELDEGEEVEEEENYFPVNEKKTKKTKKNKKKPNRKTKNIPKRIKNIEVDEEETLQEIQEEIENEPGKILSGKKIKKLLYPKNEPKIDIYKELGMTKDDIKEFDELEKKTKENFDIQAKQSPDFQKYQQNTEVISKFDQYMKNDYNKILGSIQKKRHNLFNYSMRDPKKYNEFAQHVDNLDKNNNFLNKPDCKFKKIPNLFFIDDDPIMEYNNSNYQHCQDHCCVSEQCKHFSLENNICYLSDKDPKKLPRINKDNTVSGIKNGPNCNFDITDLDFIESENISNSENNVKCIPNPSCRPQQDVVIKENCQKDYVNSYLKKENFIKKNHTCEAKNKIINHHDSLKNENLTPLPNHDSILDKIPSISKSLFGKNIEKFTNVEDYQSNFFSYEAIIALIAISLIMTLSRYLAKYK